MHQITVNILPLSEFVDIIRRHTGVSNYDTIPEMDEPTSNIVNQYMVISDDFDGDMDWQESVCDELNSNDPCLACYGWYTLLHWLCYKQIIEPGYYKIVK